MASHSSSGRTPAKTGSPEATAASYSISPIRRPPGNHASSTSITSGFGPAISAMASSITLENSGSTSTTLAPPWSSWNAIEEGSSRMLKALITAPSIGTAKCASYIAGMLGSIKATVSPRPMPWPAR